MSHCARIRATQDFSTCLNPPTCQIKTPLHGRRAGHLCYKTQRRSMHENWSATENWMRIGQCIQAHHCTLKNSPSKTSETAGMCHGCLVHRSVRSAAGSNRFMHASTWTLLAIYTPFFRTGSTPGGHIYLSIQTRCPYLFVVDLQPTPQVNPCGAYGGPSPRAFGPTAGTSIMIDETSWDS